MENLSEHNILTAPVRIPEAGDCIDWRSGIWVLENVELAVITLSAGSTTSAEVESRCCWCSGNSSLSATGPDAVAWLTIAAVGAAVAGGMAAEKDIRKDASTAADKLGEDF